MTHFIYRDNEVYVADQSAIDLRDTLEPNTYIVKLNRFEELYLENITKFEPEPKYYGTFVADCERIMTTFKSRPGSTGALFAGEKGSGKTAMGRYLSILGMQMGMPVLLFTSAFDPAKIAKFLTDIEQEVIVFFDEFEKVYNSDLQEKILSLLDGVYAGRRLFILTCNNHWRLDENMKNRPGRLFYMINFKGLDNDFIREYCNDVLNNKDHIERVCQLASMFGEFSFDMLKALVEEMNRYNESPEQAYRLLNIDPTGNRGSNHVFDVSLVVDGKDVPVSMIEDKTWIGNPLFSETIQIDLEGHESVDVATFRRDQLVRMDGPKGIFVYVDGDDKLTLTRQKSESFDLFRYL